MGTCVIAADTLNEGYQSVEVWHGGWARREERRKKKRRREKRRKDGSIEKKVEETLKKR